MHVRPQSKRGEPPFSMDANLLHISYEGNALEDPWVTPDESMFTRSVSPENVRKLRLSAGSLFAVLNAWGELTRGGGMQGLYWDLLVGVRGAGWVVRRSAVSASAELACPSLRAHADRLSMARN